MISLLALLLVPLADLQSVEEAVVVEEAAVVGTALDEEEAEAPAIEQPKEAVVVEEAAVVGTALDEEDVELPAIEQPKEAAVADPTIDEEEAEAPAIEQPIDDTAKCDVADNCDVMKESVPSIDQPIPGEVSSDNKESGMFEGILNFFYLI